MKINTVEIPRIDNLSAACITGLEISVTWLRGKNGLIGFGKKTSTQVLGVERFRTAQFWWQKQLSNLEINNSLSDSGTGPIVFASFGFQPESKSTLVLPEVVIGQNEKRAWITWFGDNPAPSIKNYLPTNEKLNLNWSPGSLSESDWQNQIDKAIAQIAQGEIEKVVIARDLIVNSSQAINIQKLIQNLETEYPNTWVFLNEGLVGATPELLIRLGNSLVTSRVLAGTIQKSGSEEKDLALAASLAKSSKDLEEHEYAVNSVATALEKFCLSMNVPESPFVLHLSNVMHLATDVTGVLKDEFKNANILDLVSQLHPSAAVCGTPTEKAMQAISNLEMMDRARYAGPVGWFNSKGEGEFGIALRCGQINENLDQVRLFAGCGIVAGSNPATELLESQAKFKPMRTALETL